MENTNQVISPPERPRREFHLDDRFMYIIFFAIIAVGLCFVVYFFTAKSNKSVKYEAVFNEQISSVIELSDKKMVLSVTVDGETITQTGTVKKVSAENLPAEYKDTSKYNLYQVDFTDEVVQVLVQGDELTLAYSTGEYLIYKEK